MKISRFQAINQISKPLNKSTCKQNKQSKRLTSQENLLALLSLELTGEKQDDDHTVIRKFCKAALMDAFGSQIINHSKYSDMLESISDSVLQDKQLTQTLCQEIRNYVK